MLNRKLHIIAVAAFLSLLPALAFASTSRLEGMSLPSDFTSDYTTIYTWPSSLTGVGNLVYGELGNTLPPYGSTLKAGQDDFGMGAVLPNLCDGKWGVWSLHLRSWTPALGQGDNQTGTNPGWFGGDPNSNINQAFELGWAYKMAKNSIGVTLQRSFNSAVEEFPGITYTFEQDSAFAMNYGSGYGLRRNIFGVAVGAGTEMSPTFSAEAAIHMQTRSYQNGRSGTGFQPFKYEDDGGMNMLFGARAMWKAQPNLVVVPVVKLHSYNLSDKYVWRVGPSAAAAHDTSVTYENKANGWQVGLAGNWSIGSNDLFVLGATVAGNTLDQQSDLFNIANFWGVNDTLTVKESIMPVIYMALETQINSWLTLRFGANKAVFHTTKLEMFNGAGTTRTKDDLEVKDSPFEMNAGAGVKLGSLKFDAVLASGFFNNPFGQLMGGTQSNTENPFAKVSATYNW